MALIVHVCLFVYLFICVCYVTERVRSQFFETLCAGDAGLANTSLQPPPKLEQSLQVLLIEKLPGLKEYHSAKECSEM